MPRSHRVAVVAASSAIPLTELALGVERLRSIGMTVDVQPQCLTQHFVFAGEDEKRAAGFFEAAMSDRCDVVWCAGGGYGAARILPLLDRMTAEHGIPPQKLLIGFSDATALLSYVQTRWHWRSLHGMMIAPMPFREVVGSDWDSLIALTKGQQPAPPWGQWQLNWIGEPAADIIEAELIGGNLSVWTSLIGTPYAAPARGRILFLEDIGEIPNRIGRMVNQLQQSGALDGAAAIVLGGFTDCDDRVINVLPPMTPQAYQSLVNEGKEIPRVPLRQKFDINTALRAIFGDVHEQTGIPIVMGLPVGHGANTTPLPLGVKYRLDVEGKLTVMRG